MAERVVVGDPRQPGSIAGVDPDGSVAVRDELLLAILAELRRIRLGISMLVHEPLDDPGP